MATSLHRDSIVLRPNRFVERWFYTGIAAAMLAVSIAGFAPALLDTSHRRGPVSLLAATHGIVYLSWLLLFLTQSLLVALQRVAWHRRLGVASTVILALMIPLGFTATVAMVRRGFDLSGDQQIDPNPQPGFLDPMTGSIFNFVSLFLFTLLTIVALCFRRRRAIHKRLMFFANIELILASMVHLLGHMKILTGPAISAFLAVFLLAVIGRDFFIEKRVHPLTLALSIFIFVLGPIQATVLGPSAAWHHLVSWLVG